MKKKLTALSTLLIAALLFSAVAYSAKNDGTEAAAQVQSTQDSNSRYESKLFQYSTINAVLQGQYEGNMTLKEVNQHGDMGLGTINNLDGELIQFENKFYQVDSTGKLRQLDEKTKTPFVVTTKFEAQETVELNNVTNFDDFSAKLKANFANKNHFYAIKITGTFNYVKARSVPAQSRPYPPLTEVTPHQSVFDFNNTEGTIIGFYTPNYAGTIQVPGFHMHYITTDKTSGGHILNVQFDHAKVEIQNLPEFDLVLPDTADFANADLTETTIEDIEEAEGDK